ncbi:MAG: HlyC/CorC family transporter [Chloroflexi bacterium]|nr:HlyC/CorC family transporter [Chloroflexota bacterium]
MAHSESKKESTGNHQRNSRRSSTGLLGKLISLFRRNRHASQDPPPAILVDTEGHEQILEEDESQMVRSIIALDETMAREIMVPRIDVVALDVNTSLSDVVRTIIERGFSRIPIYEDTIDNIVGVLYAKDILRLWGQPDDKLDIRKIARTPHFIPETKRIDELLQEFRDKRVHMAIVVDEYGGVAGLVSLEDLVEEIVGEIEDEFDTGEPQIETISPTEVIMDAGVSIDLLNETLSLDIQGEDFDSIGGFIFDRLGKIPSPGDEIRADGFVVSVLSTTGRRIRKVKIVKVSTPEGQD